MARLSDVRLETTEFHFPLDVSFLSEDLIMATNIITQHFGIWSRRKPGATMQSLTQARTLCQALLSLCAATGDRDEKKMVAYLKIALHNKSWDKVWHAHWLIPYASHCCFC